MMLLLFWASIKGTSFCVFLLIMFSYKGFSSFVVVSHSWFIISFMSILSLGFLFIIPRMKFFA